MLPFSSNDSLFISSSPLFVDSFGNKISQTCSRMRTLLTTVGLKGEDFAGISLRRGGAQVLLRLKANDRVVMGMGRWKSDAFRRYVRTEERDIEEWQRANIVCLDLYEYS